MNIHRFPSPIIADRDIWLFHAHAWDAEIAVCQSDAEKIAEEWNGYHLNFAVVRFNSVDGTSRDVTEDFWRAQPDYLDEYEAEWKRLRKAGAF